MADKVFKRTLSDRFKKGLVVAAAFLTLGTPKAHADGFLEKVTGIIENVSDKVGNFNSKLACLNIARGKLEKNIERVDYNTGSIVGDITSVISVRKAQKAVKKQVEENGTYQATSQEFAQASRISNSSYLSNVKSKLNKNSTESRSSVQKQTTQQTQKRTVKSKAYSQDVQNVLNVLNSGGRK